MQESEERDLFSVPFNPEVKGTSLVEHLQFMVKASLLIADQLKKAHGYKIDLGLLIASALFHNPGKVFEYRRQGGRFKKTAIGKFFPHGFWGAFLALREGLKRWWKNGIRPCRRPAKTGLPRPGRQDLQGDRLPRPEGVLGIHAG